MKVKMNANEITDANIEFVSLVGKGANRSPFKILKTEDVVKESETFISKVSKFFGHQEQGHITSIIVKQAVASTVFPILKAHGFKIAKDSVIKSGDNLIVTQDGFSVDDPSTLIALTDSVAVSTSKLIKRFEPWVDSPDFDESVAAASFYPSYYGAEDGLTNTIHTILDTAETPAEAKALIETATQKFSIYVTALVEALPTTLFKLEKDLRTAFEGSTVDVTKGTTSPTEPKKGTTMKTDQLTEAAAGDLDGLLDEPTTPVEKSESTTEPTKVEKEGEKETLVEKDTEIKEEKLEDTKADDETLTEMQVLVKAVSQLAAGIVSLKDTVEKQGTEIEAIGAKATEAITKADNTVLSSSSMSDLNTSLHTLSGGTRSLNKESSDKQDIWKGALPAFDLVHADNK